MAGTDLRVVNGKRSAVGSGLTTRQAWKSADGHRGWLVDEHHKNGIALDTEEQPYLNGPSYDYLAGLPTDPDALLKKIYADTAGHGPGPDAEAFTTIGDLLAESYPPAALSAALYKAAGKIPGVAQVNDAADALGRHGIAVARLDETSGVRSEWIFDRTTFAFLGERQVQVGASAEPDLIKPGTVIHTSAVTARTIVDGIKQTAPHRA